MVAGIYTSLESTSASDRQRWGALPSPLCPSAARPTRPSARPPACPSTRPSVHLFTRPFVLPSFRPPAQPADTDRCPCRRFRKAHKMAAVRPMSCEDVAGDGWQMRGHGCSARARRSCSSATPLRPSCVRPQVRRKRGRQVCSSCLSRSIDSNYHRRRTDRRRPLHPARPRAAYTPPHSRPADPDFNVEREEGGGLASLAPHHQGDGPASSLGCVSMGAYEM